MRFQTSTSSNGSVHDSTVLKSCSIKFRLNTTGISNPLPPAAIDDVDTLAKQNSCNSTSKAFSYDEEAYAPIDRCLLGRYTCHLPVKVLAQADAVVSNVSLVLFNTSLKGLTELLEDELIPEPLPVKVSDFIFV